MSELTYADEHFHRPKNVELLDGCDNVAYSWKCYDPEGDNDQGLNWSNHVHTIECLWIWHDCTEVLGPQTVAPGQRWGWRPAGVAAHTLISQHPLHIEASVYWPDCCGLHGFVRDGRWQQV